MGSLILVSLDILLHGITTEMDWPIFKSALTGVSLMTSGDYCSLRQSLLILQRWDLITRPLLLDTNPSLLSTPKPFRFETIWTLHADTGHIITTTSNKSHSFSSKLKITKIVLKEWNKKVLAIYKLRSKTSNKPFHSFPSKQPSKSQHPRSWIYTYERPWWPLH